ncbi:unnamed protein product [Prorocentrum cordatum]|uniref:Cyclin n=1 Tax=Prorocentrum cordatum TaxID=2364126 RepID=A0ABN9SP25_9DINO|nr:unnamed protein product [Polarella glacialis]
MTTEQVLAYWKLADTKTELLVRRLRWYQSWASRPWHHAQLLSTLFADLPGINAEAPCTEEGLSQSASPWATRVGADISMAVNFMEDDADVLEELGRAPWKLEADRDLAKQFLKLDFSRVRAIKHAVSVPPPAPPAGVQQAERDDDNNGSDQEEDDALNNIFVCGSHCTNLDSNDMADVAMPNWLKRGADTTGPHGSEAVSPPKEKKPKGKAEGGNPGGGGGKGGAAGIADLCKATAKLSMATARQVAALEACVYDNVAIREAEGMLGDVLVSGGQEYDAESKAMKARQATGETVDFKARGSPHIRLFCKALYWVIERTGPQGAGTSATVHKLLMQYWTEQVMHKPPKILEQANVGWICDKCMLYNGPDWSGPVLECKGGSCAGFKKLDKDGGKGKGKGRGKGKGKDEMDECRGLCRLVKGNLFSFSMPWDDIERCCREASQRAEEIHGGRLKLLQDALGVPHSEETLAMLVNVRIKGGSKDLAQHLKRLTLRIPVMRKLMELMRDSGYPGYGNNGLNSFDRVATRLHERYSQKYAETYGEAKFIPQAVQDAVQQVAERSALVGALARVLSHLCLAGVGRPRASVGFDAKRAPSIPIRAYLQRVSDHFECSSACLIASLVYMDRAAKLHSSQLVSARSVHRMLLASMVLAAKYCDDAHYKNVHYATIGGIGLQELNDLEERFLRLINWRLHIMEDEYDLYKNHVLLAAKCNP